MNEKRGESARRKQDVLDEQVFLAAVLGHNRSKPRPPDDLPLCPPPTQATAFAYLRVAAGAFGGELYPFPMSPEEVDAKVKAAASRLAEWLKHRDPFLKRRPTREEALERLERVVADYEPNLAEYQRRLQDDPLTIALRDEETARAVYDALQKLSHREHAVLCLRCGLGDDPPKGLEEVGEAFGVTRERVRQIEAKAIRKVRHPSRSGALGNRRR